MRENDPEVPEVGGLSDTLEQRWAALRGRLDDAAEFLARQGSVASRRAGKAQVWSVRYHDALDGRRVQRSIYVGGDRELFRRTAAYLAELRAETEWFKGLPAFCRRARGLVREASRRRKVS